VSDRSSRIEATVRGTVQGVGFRYFVQRRANRLGLRGWVANELDGSVRCVAEGPDEALDELIAVLHRGPPGSHVGTVHLSRTPATNSFDGFRIRPTGHRGD
jgi:acylphosphatase